jgi:hypothetical protein
MIAEIAAANAAYSVLKQALNAGREIYECSAVAQKYFDNKSVVAKRVAAKGQSDMESFMALERFKANEEHLRETIIYAGRPGMWDDWLAFQAKCKRDREQAARVAKIKRNNQLKMLKQFITIIGTSIAVIPVVIYLLVYLVEQI